MFWSKTCVQHNGFFGAKTLADTRLSENSSPDHTLSANIDSWFRMIVKSIKPTHKDVECTNYQWYEMSFISTSGENRNLLLCLDTPRHLLYHILDTLNEEENRDVAFGPYGLHQALLEQLMILYDESVWDIARIMRNNEKSKGVYFTKHACIMKPQTDTGFHIADGKHGPSLLHKTLRRFSAHSTLYRSNARSSKSC